MLAVYHRFQHLSNTLANEVGDPKKIVKQLHGKSETCRASEWQSHRSDPDCS